MPHTTFYHLKYLDIAAQLVHFDNFNNRCIIGINTITLLKAKFASNTSYFVLEEMEIIKNEINKIETDNCVTCEIRSIKCTICVNLKKKVDLYFQYIARATKINFDLNSIYLKIHECFSIADISTLTNLILQLEHKSSFNNFTYKNNTDNKDLETNANFFIVNCAAFGEFYESLQDKDIFNRHNMPLSMKLNYEVNNDSLQINWINKIDCSLYHVLYNNMQTCKECKILLASFMMRKFDEKIMTLSHLSNIFFENDYM